MSNVETSTGMELLLILIGPAMSLLLFLYLWWDDWKSEKELRKKRRMDSIRASQLRELKGNK